MTYVLKYAENEAGLILIFGTLTAKSEPIQIA